MHPSSPSLPPQPQQPQPQPSSIDSRTWHHLRSFRTPFPNEGISQLSLSPRTQQVVLICTWTGHARLLNTVDGSQLHHTTHSAAVLCGVFESSAGKCFFSGGLDKCIRVTDTETGRWGVVGKHDEAVRCAVHRAGLLVTGSWDQSLHFHDARANGPAFETLVSDRVYALDAIETTSGTLFTVAGLRGGTIVAHDARRPDIALFQRPCSLQHQIRCVRLFEDGKGIIAGSIEGRVAVENFEEAASYKRYAFKCHRREEIVYPVNAIAVLQHGIFATAGADGTAQCWEAFTRKRFAKLDHVFETSCSSLDFYRAPVEGMPSMLGVAQSYTFELGPNIQHPDDEIVLFEAVI